MRESGAPILSISDNYYDDLDARFALAPAVLAAMRECGVLYDRDQHGELFHLYTDLLGSRVFFEVVQRVGGYTGYGAVNSPVRMAAHRAARVGGKNTARAGQYRNTRREAGVAFGVRSDEDLRTRWGDPAVIRRMLSAGDTWAVVGLSQNTARDAHGIARMVQRRGKRIVPVHPRAETVFGEKGYRTLAEIPFPVDVVDVFVRSELAGSIADQAVDMGALAVWFQLGVIDEDAFRRVTAAGLDMVMDRCPAIEWPRLGPATLDRG